MNRLEKLKLEMAFNYPNVYEIVHMNADTPRLSGAEYLTHGFKAGFDAASTEYEKIIAELEKILIVSKGAMAYAYEDHGDTFYLNVKEDIEKALQKLKEFRGGE